MQIDRKKIDRVYTSHFQEGELLPWKGVVFKIRKIEGEEILLEAVGATKKVAAVVRLKAGIV